MSPPDPSVGCVLTALMPLAARSTFRRSLESRSLDLIPPNYIRPMVGGVSALYVVPSARRDRPTAVVPALKATGLVAGRRGAHTRMRSSDDTSPAQAATPPTRPRTLRG